MICYMFDDVGLVHTEVYDSFYESYGLDFFKKHCYSLARSHGLRCKFVEDSDA